MNYLFISAHTDDAEFGAGATIARLVEEGHKVTVIALSYCGNKELKGEMNNACNVLGVHSTEIHDYPVRRFSENRQNLLDKLLEIKEKYKPDVVFTFSKHDIHQDHKVIYEESVRAFKDLNIYGYSFPHNNLEFPASCFFKVDESHVKAKMVALTCYKSQHKRRYMDKEVLNSNLLYRGLQAGTKYAECFELIKQVL